MTNTGISVNTDEGITIAEYDETTGKFVDVERESRPSPYHLTDAVKVDAEHPDTFGVRSLELAVLKAGDMVKLIFEPPKALTRPGWATSG